MIASLKNYTLFIVNIAVYVILFLDLLPLSVGKVTRQSDIFQSLIRNTPGKRSLKFS